MIIGIDGNEANTPLRVGVGQYAFNLITALYQHRSHHTFHLYLKSPPLPDLPPATSNWQYHLIGPSSLWTKIALPFHLFTDGLHLDLFYSPSHYSPHFSPFPTIPTIHDLGYLQSQDQFNKKDIYQLVNWTKHSLKHARQIIAVSQFTKDDLIKTYHLAPNKISLVYNGVQNPPQITSDQTKTVLSKFSINQPYFLALGTLKPNKNYPFLINAFSTYLKNHSSTHLLVIAGKKGWLFNDIFRSVQEEKMESNVIFTDYISETEKWALLANALSLVIPSTYEGFGIPAIESQAVGTPVIASNIPAISEILQQSALFINPYQPSTLVQALTQIQQPTTRKHLIALGHQQSTKFTWDQSAIDLLKAFDKIK